MKLLATVSCLTLLACITVHAALNDQGDCISQELPNDETQISSEVDFRNQFLAQIYPVLQDENTRGLQKTDDNCTAELISAQTELVAFKSNLDNIFTSITLPIGVKDAVTGIINLILESLKAALPSPGISQATSFVVTALATLFSGFTTLPMFGKIIAPLAAILKGLQDTIAKVISCSPGATNKMEIDASSCDKLADLYRSLVEESSKINPIVPVSASPETKRLVTGSLAVLDIMDKSSISSFNQDLLSTSSVFAGTLLDHYRRELLRRTNDANLQQFTLSYLGPVVGISNALEACLHIASNPPGSTTNTDEKSVN
ncbi:hypothetical protein BGX28_002862 [Mortierella sp. GBA30]|nr:hypothetical protein BGX28_002862 [Mortierella sp. GBA30]